MHKYKYDLNIYIYIYISYSFKLVDRFRLVKPISQSVPVDSQVFIPDEHRFRLVKPISQSVPVDSQVFIPDEQAVDRFTWYGQMVDQFNLKSIFSSFKPNES